MLHSRAHGLGAMGPPPPPQKKNSPHPHPPHSALTQVAPAVRYHCPQGRVFDILQPAPAPPPRPLCWRLLKPLRACASTRPALLPRTAPAATAIGIGILAAAAATLFFPLQQSCSPRSTSTPELPLLLLLPRIIATCFAGVELEERGRPLHLSQESGVGGVRLWQAARQLSASALGAAELLQGRSQLLLAGQQGLQGARAGQGREA
jgi:hypothetical protein